ncbi:MAG TPA: DMT family transporter [Dongiaceae bacterium]|nr:DMT family transporter [Dongiaceae bacterium]
MNFDKIKALPGQQNHVLIAAGLTIFAGLCFAGLSAQVKFLTSDLHGFVITFWRNFWGLFFMLPWLIRQGLGELSWPRIRMFTLRSGLSLASMLLGFTSLSYLTLANATALSFTAPLFATVLAALVLGETVRRRRWTATFVGFVGVLIVLRPSVSGISYGEILALSGAFLTALVIIVVKQMSRTEPSNAIVAYMVLLLTPMSLVVALPFWSWPQTGDWPFVIGMGLAGTVGHVCWTRAISICDASVVVPFDYVRLIFTIIIGILAFAEQPDMMTLIGAAIIVLAGIYIARREAMLNQRSAREAVAASGDPSRPAERDAA